MANRLSKIVPLSIILILVKRSSLISIPFTAEMISVAAYTGSMALIIAFHSYFISFSNMVLPLTSLKMSL